MTKNRLEAFSDGVLAIIITIMVLELRAPAAPTWAALAELWPTFSSYVLSFYYVGTYWNNHHHLLHACKQVTAGVLWANLNLLFWLSLFPFATAWMGRNHRVAAPVATYGAVMLLAALAYYVLQSVILAGQDRDSKLVAEFGADWKGKLSLVAFLAAIPLAGVQPWFSHAIYVLVGLAWIIPDRRIERALR